MICVLLVVKRLFTCAEIRVVTRSIDVVFDLSAYDRRAEEVARIHVEFGLRASRYKPVRCADVDFEFRLLVFSDIETAVRAAFLSRCFDTIISQWRFLSKRELAIECPVF